MDYTDSDNAALTPSPPDTEDQSSRSLTVRAGLTAVGLLAVLFFAYFLLQVQSTLILLIVGILLATAITGPVEYLHRYLRLRRGLAILLVYLAILGALALAVTLLVPPIAREGTTFARDFPRQIDTLRTDAWRPARMRCCGLRGPNSSICSRANASPVRLPLCRACS